MKVSIKHLRRGRV